MEKPVQWMTLQELRDDLYRTQAAWEAELDSNGVLTGEPLPALSQDAHRHQEVVDELLRRPNNW
jgi:hypothetical protein